MKLNNNYFLPILFVAAIALSCGLYFGQPKVPEKTTVATVLNQARTFMPFNLIDSKGNAFANESFKGHWSFLFFGFTQCPALCPTTMAILKSVEAKMRDQKVKRMPQIVFISIDPDYDNSERLSHYLKQFSPNFLGVTGDKQQIEALTKSLGIVYMKVASRDPNKTYDIDHSGTLLLVNPKGKLQAFFSLPHVVNNIVHDFKIISQQT